MLFDTWGGLLSDGCVSSAFRSTPMRAVLRAICLPARSDDRVHQGRAGSLASIARIGGELRSGSTGRPTWRDARRRHGARVALQGNLDPLALADRPATRVEAAVADRRCARPDRSRATCSTWGMASFRRRRPRMSQRWSMPCTRISRSAAPGATAPGVARGRIARKPRQASRSRGLTNRRDLEAASPLMHKTGADILQTDT